MRRKGKMRDLKGHPQASTKRPLPTLLRPTDSGSAVEAIQWVNGSPAYLFGEPSFALTAVTRLTGCAIAGVGT